MNLPNILTVLRIILSGIFLYTIFIENFAARTLSLFIFLLATLTDYLDGYFARRNKQVSEFGQLMDPIADKFLTLSAFLAFVQMGIVPAWMVAIILTRDIVITLVRFSMPTSSAQSARKSGKQKTVLQFACIIGILLFLTFKETAFWNSAWTEDTLRGIYVSTLLIVAMTVWSGVRYLVKNAKTR